MRKVVNSEQVAHLWANQSQDEAWNGTRSVSFHGRDLYSYRTVIARLARSVGGETIALFDRQSYSVTTSKHQSRARYAARHLTGFTVDDVFASSPRAHGQNLAGLVAEFHAACKRYVRALGDPYSTDYLESGGETANNYATCFGLTPPLDVAAEVAATVAAREKSLARRNSPAGIRRREKAAERRAEKKRIEREEHAARHIEETLALRERWDTEAVAAYGSFDAYVAAATNYAREFAANTSYRGVDSHGWYSWYTCRAIQSDIYGGESRARFEQRILGTLGSWDSVAAFFAGITAEEVAAETATAAGRALDPYLLLLESEIVRIEDRETVEKWRAGERVYPSRDIPTMLRARGETVETSLGAVVPIEHARRLFNLVAKCRADAREWIPNGHSVHVGAFTVSRIGADGTLEAGCHVIGWAEIESFARSLGWA